MRLKRIYTLRDLFRQGIRGQVDLNGVITHGDPLTRRVALLAAFWVKITNDWIFNLSARHCTLLLSNRPHGPTAQVSHGAIKPHRGPKGMWEIQNCPTAVAAPAPGYH
jgi:hypothetical protein